MLMLIPDLSSKKLPIILEEVLQIYLIILRKKVKSKDNILVSIDMSLSKKIKIQ